MNKLYRVSLSVSFVLLMLTAPKVVSGQSTWDQVYTVLSTSCAQSSACHDGSLPFFDANASKADLYNALVNQFPLNGYAKDSLEYYLVEPGHPDRSFLFRKIAHGLGTFRRDFLELAPAEGSDMPTSGSLSKTEIELVRQWILAGADSSSLYPTADTALLSAFYNGNGRPLMQAPVAPAAGEGFQVHFGPIFFPPNSESEYFMKDSLKLPGAMDIEVTGLELFMNDESHHFILRYFRTPEDWDEGLTPLNPLTAFDSDKDYVMAWQNDEAFFLPDSTAYFWDGDIVFDHNFHMLNPHNEILAGEVFLNVYTSPLGTAKYEMKSRLVNNAALFIPNNGQEVVFDASYNMSNASVWSLASHTHANGKDFKIWLDGDNGAPDSLVYDGMVDYTTGVNMGFYDYEHPPNRFWDTFMDNLMDTLPGGLKKYSGFKYQAKYINNSPRLQTFGFTTEDEMMIFYVQYIDGEYKVTTGINDDRFELKAANLSVNPNPMTDASELSFTITEPGNASIEVTDILGRTVASVLENETLAAGKHTYALNNVDVSNAGVYFVTLTVDGQSATTKVVITE